MTASNKAPFTVALQRVAAFTGVAVAKPITRYTRQGTTACELAQLNRGRKQNEARII